MFHSLPRLALLALLAAAPLCAQPVLVSHATGTPGTVANGASYGVPIRDVGGVSDDGRWCLYISQGTNIVTGQVDSNADWDLFLWDSVANTSQLVSHTPGSAVTTGNAASSYSPSISADGRFVAFVSYATNLVAGVTDTNASEDVFLFDRITGTVTLVSHNAASLTTTGNSESAGNPIISDDGNFIAYTSRATNMVAGQGGPNIHQVFMYDRATGNNTMVSHVSGSTSTAGNAAATLHTVSADGRFVSFFTVADNLIAGVTDTNSGNDVFNWDRTGGTVTLVSHAASSTTTAGNGASSNGKLSADGNWIAFTSGATDLIAGVTDANTGSDVFLYNRVAGTSSLVSHASGSATTTAGTGSVGQDPSSISADGRFVAFYSNAANVVAGQVGTSAVFLFDRTTGNNAMVSHAASSLTTCSNAGGGNGIVSNAGDFVVFEANSTDLVAGQADSNAAKDVFRFTTATGAMTLVSHIPGSPLTTGNGSTDSTSVSASCRFVFFQSSASDSVAGDGNGAADVFAYSFKIAPAITWANPADIVYGTALSATQLNATCPVAGTFSYTPAAGIVLSAGASQTLNLTFTPTDTGTYNAATANVSINVTPAPLTITAENKSMVQGAAVPALTAVYAGFVNGDTAASLTTPVSLGTTATSASVPGSYPITATGATAANYAIAHVNGTMAVIAAPAPLTITAENKTMVQGTAVPTLTASYVGFINGDTPASLTTPVVLGTTATSASVPGSYPITATGATGSTYTITHVNGGGEGGGVGEREKGGW